MGYCINPSLIRGHIVPCRTCLPCYNWKKYQWKYRLKNEILCSDRIWFATFTYRLTPDIDELRNSWQKYMKRTRKNAHASPSDLRYFTVTERGSLNGRLHLHSLIFCSGNMATVGEKQLRRTWKAGHSHCRLLRSGTTYQGIPVLRYVLKYVTKDYGKVFASQKIGYRALALDHVPPPWFCRKTNSNFWGIHAARMKWSSPPLSMSNSNPILSPLEGSGVILQSHENETIPGTANVPFWSAHKVQYIVVTEINRLALTCVALVPSLRTSPLYSFCVAEGSKSEAAHKV